MNNLSKFFTLIFFYSITSFSFGQDLTDFKLNPPSLKYYYPEKQIDKGYSQIIYNVEGVDALNYFGQRLTEEWGVGHPITPLCIL